MLERLDELFTEVEQAGRVLAGEPKVSEEVRTAVLRVSTAREEMAPDELAAVDPYLVMALDRGLLGAWRGFDADTPEEERAIVRVALEQIRQALRDIRDEAPSSETRPAKEIARWLDATWGAPQAEVADLLGVSLRQYQRWLSPAGAEPRGRDAQRLRVLAQVVAQLRHAWTGPGVLRWLTAPHPELGGDAPASLLDDVDAAPRLRRLASASRSTRAA